MLIYVEKGDIAYTHEHVDAIATLINPDGRWFGGVDRAIINSAGTQFHGQAAGILVSSGLSDQQAVIARQIDPSYGNFDNVIFVVDALESPLDRLVTLALVAAQSAGMHKIALPTMRTGLVAGIVEPTDEAAVQTMVRGIDTFVTSYPSDTMTLYLVVYREEHIFKLLEQLTAKYRPNA